MNETFGCGCGEEDEFDWDEFARILRGDAEEEKEDSPIEVTEDSPFAPARKREEVEANR